jgi:hypothetical protein
MTEEEWLNLDDAPRLMCGLQGYDVSYRKMVLFEIAAAETLGLNQISSIVAEYVEYQLAWIENRPRFLSQTDADNLTEDIDVLSEELRAQSLAYIQRLGVNHPEAISASHRYTAIGLVQHFHIGSPWWEWVPNFVNDQVQDEVDPFTRTLLGAFHDNRPILHCIIGNPFRPVACDPSWRTPTAAALADAIYTDQAFDRLPILADALEEAGCDHPDVLAHCRGPGPHARGCWVVDMILGKS